MVISVMFYMLFVLHINAYNEQCIFYRKYSIAVLKCNSMFVYHVIQMSLQAFVKKKKEKNSH